MRIDLYTKGVLTVIAAALITLSVRSFEEPTQVLAQGPTRVIIAGIESQSQQLQHGLPVYIYASNPQQSVPVAVVATGANVQVPVKLTGASQDGKSAVAVNVVQVAGSAVDQKGIPVVSQK